MKKWLRRGLGSFLVLIPAALLFLFGTDTGLRCLTMLSNRLSADILTIGSASGSLYGTLELRDIRYADGIDTVLIDALHLTWNPSQLLDRQVRIHEIRGTGVRVLLGASSAETVLPPFSIPGSVLIDTVSAETIAIYSGREEVWSIRTGTIKNISLQEQTLNFEALSLANEQFTIEAKGQLRTSSGYPLQLVLESRFHPAGYEPITARGTVAGPLNELQIKVDTQTPFPVHLKGRLNNLLGATNWQAQLESPEVELNRVHHGWPEQRFTKVVIDGQGTLDDYTLHIHSQAGLPKLKELCSLTAELQGNSNGIQLSTLRLTQGKTELLAHGTLAWNPNLSWQAEISGAHLDPSLFLADWPGDFAGTLTTAGHLTPHGLDASFHLPALHGTLRNFSLAGNGEIRMQDKQLQIPQLLLKSGGSILRISGKAAETIDLALQFDSSNLAELWPRARGKVNAHGHITGKAEKPQVDFKLMGSAIGAGGDGVQKVTIETKGILAAKGVLDTSIRAEQLQLGSTSIDLCRLQLKGSLHDHGLELTTQNREFTSGFALQGKFENGLWQGTLKQARFTSKRFGDWRQRQDTPLTLSTDKADVKPLCLAASAASSLCVNGSWLASADTWQLHGAASALPLDLLQTGTTLTLPIKGQLAAEIDLTGQQSRILSGKLSANSNGMSIRIPLADGGDHQVTWKNNSLVATYAANRLQTRLDSELTDNSVLHAELTFTDLQFTQEKILRTPMSGSIQFRIQDLTPFAVLTDQNVTLSGALRGRFTVNGTPAAPLLNGQMELADGQAEIPPLGITLSPLLLRMTGDLNGVQLSATAHSGKGFLRAESSLQANQMMSGPHTVHLSGDTFQVAHLPGLDLDVSPDLLMVFSNSQTTVRGTVTIPQARITSIDFHNTTALSNDMVVVDEEISPVKAAVPLFADITVVAGEDVHIDAYGLRGDIAGKLAIKEQPGRPMVGNGTLSVHKGSFTVYGKRLKIDLGRLLFTGGPLTNPGIELRSERKKGKVTTGMIIDGFLQRPEMHFYSNPSMEQSAIVANLLESSAVGGETRQDLGMIGSTASKIGLGGMVPYLQSLKKLSMVDEIKLEKGDTYDSFSLVFGSWLTPDFYVSYGKALVSESGSLSTRYSLGKDFYLLLETGSSYSGGDILYEFER